MNSNPLRNGKNSGSDGSITRAPGEPYCSNCSYALSGCTESSKCPECGLPIVDVLVRGTAAGSDSGKRFRSKATILGKPVIHIALGPKHGEPIGKARGFIAIGNDAVGFLAIGGGARGFVAIGGGATGVFAAGGGTIGVFGVGGGSLGVFAAGGGAAGIISSGGGSVGVIAQGGGVVGWAVRGYGMLGVHQYGSSPTATTIFDTALGWFFGPANMYMAPSPWSIAVNLGLVGIAGAVVGLIGWRAYRRNPGGEPVVA